MQPAPTFSTTTPSHAVSTITGKRYLPLQTLGKGSFGRVVLAEDLEFSQGGSNAERRYVAVKVIDKERAPARAMGELALLSSLASRFVCPLLDSFETPNFLYLVLAFLQGGDLYELLVRVGGTMPWENARFYAAEMLIGLEHLHDKGITYRDLKPENVLLDSRGHVVLVDLGLAKAGTTEFYGCLTFVGSCEYVSPEIACRHPTGWAADLWSLGMVLHELVIGLPPFYERDKIAGMQRIVSERFALVADGRRVPYDLVDLLNGLLCKDPRFRTNAKQVRSSLFFSGLDFHDLEARNVQPPYVPRLSSDNDVSCFAPASFELDASERGGFWA